MKITMKEMVMVMVMVKMKVINREAKAGIGRKGGKVGNGGCAK